jgi:dATP pyrophosphohydrolase
MRLPVQVEGFVFYKKGDVPYYLLLKRVKERGGFWQPVTGGLEEGESIQECMFRELREETGLECSTLMDPKFTFEFKDGEGKVLTEHVFGLPLANEVQVTISGEHSEFKWVRLEEALHLLKWDTNKKAIEKVHFMITSHSR